MKSIPIRVAIVDDEPLARLALRTRLENLPGFELVAEYGDGDTAVEGLAALRPDLVFIDVEMPGRSGLEVLRALPSDSRPMAVLVTAYDSFALQAFDLAALDYLLKPVDDERLEEALDRARRAFPWRRQADTAQSTPWIQTFTVRAGASTVLVRTSEVERIESDGDYATLYVGEKTYLVRERLHLLALQLDPLQFQRVHRSAIVRIDMVVELRALTNRDAMLRLRDGRLLRASRTYMPALREALERHNVR
ncbi:LytR/AlgR family response regulator transcription factor [Rugamonas aquatica]|uniref:Response regulator n=1 Tax=Rugamonas aquatica TaxID=2743357 RepID=A0A6A7N335_9BURK|nr:LytTR family DNA-binding domain-containing protein [Rugamonas aquatica]MQA39412.1 response regulator [Rugamonas aquatica]